MRQWRRGLADWYSECKQRGFKSPGTTRCGKFIWKVWACPEKRRCTQWQLLREGALLDLKKLFAKGKDVGTTKLAFSVPRSKFPEEFPRLCFHFNYYERLEKLCG